MASIIPANATLTEERLSIHWGIRPYMVGRSGACNQFYTDDFPDPNSTINSLATSAFLIYHKEKGWCFDEAFKQAILEPDRTFEWDPEAYHREIYQHIANATKGKTGPAATEALQNALRKLGAEISTPGSRLNYLATTPGGK
jgi:hypothetical protein